MLKIRKKKMLKKILDDVRVKRTILTLAIVISIMVILVNGAIAIEYAKAGLVFRTSIRILSCLIWVFIGGCSVHIVRRDFIRKKNV
jgi:hypothetical protein